MTRLAELDSRARYKAKHKEKILIQQRISHAKNRIKYFQNLLIELKKAEKEVQEHGRSTTEANNRCKMCK